MPCHDDFAEALMNDHIVRLICVEVIPTSLNELKPDLEKLLVNHEDPTRISDSSMWLDQVFVTLW